MAVRWQAAFAHGEARTVRASRADASKSVGEDRRGSLPADGTNHAVRIHARALVEGSLDSRRGFDTTHSLTGHRSDVLHAIVQFRHDC